MKAKTKESKCIIFLRVSTTSQTTDGQSDNVIRMAEASGYTREQMYFIEEQESGIKLSEEERLGLNKMKQLIETDSSIDCVFTSEVSRIARTKKVLFSIEDYLIKRNIQLSIYEPRIDLLNSDGSVNDAAETIFTLYSQFAESEMRTKKLRFAYGKARCRREGKWDGTMLPLGYTVDEDKFVRIDEKSAQVVRMIFNMYASGEWSTTTLAQELQKLNVNDDKHRAITQSRVADILMTERYTGEDIYPQIITRELYEKCKQLRKSFRTVRKNNYSAQCLCNRLIKCPNCGYHLTSSARTYRCFNHHEHPDRCSYKTELAIDVLDDIVWRVAATLEVSELMRENQEKRIHYQTELDNLHTKLDVLEVRYQAISKKRARVKSLVVDDFLTKEEAEEKLKQLDLQEVRLKEEHTALLNDIEQTQRLYDAASAPAMSLEDIERLSSSLPEDVRKKKQIVRRQIKEIKIGEWNVRNVSDCKDIFNIGLKKKRCMDITVEDIYGYIHTFRYWPRWGFGTNKIEELLDD